MVGQIGGCLARWHQALVWIAPSCRFDVDAEPHEVLLELLLQLFVQAASYLQLRSPLLLQTELLLS